MKSQRSIFLAAGALIALGNRSNACDLCAINNAATARSEVTGWVLTLAEQYTSYGTVQLNDVPVVLPDPTFVESSISHIIPGYNFNRDLGLSLNMPIAHREFDYVNYFDGKRHMGTEQGLGDISLVTRWTPWSFQEMTRSLRFNLLAGVKLPTGDTTFVREAVQEEQMYDALLGPGQDHHFAAVHQEHLSLGSGSFDGVFGFTSQARWKRFFATTEAQYYLRTEGESGFEFGDSVMISGGPGVYVVTKPNFTMSVQAVLRYENTERSAIDSEPLAGTGMREIYAGPDIALNVGRHFSLKTGADLPLDISNHGLQVVPDWRFHASVTWSF